MKTMGHTFSSYREKQRGLPFDIISENFFKWVILVKEHTELELQ